MQLRDRVGGLLKDLVSIKSPSGKEGKIQEFLEKRLMSVRLPVERQYISEDRFNLLYKTDSPYLISCHVDTVPPMGMKGAFKAIEKDGYIHGRGASDVKGSLASLITAIEVLAERGFKPKVNLAFVVDEETNSALGSERAVEIMGNCEKCLVLEPTYGRFCVAQEGSLEFSVRVVGKDVHGAEYMRTENPLRTLWKFINHVDREMGRDLNILQMKGGSGLYVTPKEAYALLEIKLREGEIGSEIEEKIMKIAQGVKGECDISVKVEDCEEFIHFRKNGFVDMLEDIYKGHVGKEPKRGVMPSWTDASNYHRAGMECVVFGEGSLMDSHTDREKISVNDLENMTKFFIGLLERVR